jgi:hypothetical protein
VDRFYACAQTLAWFRKGARSSHLNAMIECVSPPKRGSLA